MRKEEQAFTLLEIMLVVTIIALLLAAAIKFMAPNVDIAKRVRVTGFGNGAINRSTAFALAAIYGTSSNRSLG